jgi:hypothetical protein
MFWNASIQFPTFFCGLFSAFLTWGFWLSAGVLLAHACRLAIQGAVVHVHRALNFLFVKRPRAVADGPISSAYFPITEERPTWWTHAARRDFHCAAPPFNS